MVELLIILPLPVAVAVVVVVVLVVVVAAQEVTYPPPMYFLMQELIQLQLVVEV
jgi:hypothetical protein